MINEDELSAMKGGDITPSRVLRLIASYEDLRKHNAIRVQELLEANCREVTRRREAEDALELAERKVTGLTVCIAQLTTGKR